MAFLSPAPMLSISLHLPNFQTLPFTPKISAPVPPNFRPKFRCVSLQTSILQKTAQKNAGDPFGRKDLGKGTVKWLAECMGKMATTLVDAEMKGDVEITESSLQVSVFMEQAHSFLDLKKVPKIWEDRCIRAKSHYPTVFESFQRELREVLVRLQEEGKIKDWRETAVWKAIKKQARSVEHRSISRNPLEAKNVNLELSKANIAQIQTRVEEFVSQFSELLRLEKDAELGITENVLGTNASFEDQFDPIPTENVAHQEQEARGQDSIHDLTLSTSFTGLGGMHIISLQPKENRLLPTNLSPGDMVCIRIENDNGGAVTDCMQGSLSRIDPIGAVVEIAIQARYWEPAVSRLFGRTLRVDRIPDLANAITYERNCQALEELRKNGLRKENPAFLVVATLFGDELGGPFLLEANEVNTAEQGKSKDTELFDESQLRAIEIGLQSENPVVVIQGPPGTGKTSVIAEIVRRSILRGEKVLATAPSNLAVDNMVERLASMSLNVVRVGNPVRMAETVTGRSLDFLVSEEISKSRMELFQKKADIRRSLRQKKEDEASKSEAQRALRKIGKEFKKKELETLIRTLTEADVILCTNTGAAEPLLKRLPVFDLVLIDEAGQSIQPSCWIPMLQGKRTILAGDVFQLAPTIISKQAAEGGLSVSLMERASGLYGGTLSTALSIQYRMNDAIASWASQQMYKGILRSDPSVASHLLISSEGVEVNWRTRSPLLLLDTRLPFGSLATGCEEHLDPSTGSFYNDGEAEIVVEHVKALLSAGIPGSSIAVQSPYISQVQLLSELLEGLVLVEKVQIATIDSFQGREADAVIISLVRSNDLGLIGFLGDERRLNVAITRARKHVAVVCDSSTVSSSPFIAKLLQHIRQHGEVRTAQSQTVQVF